MSDTQTNKLVELSKRAARDELAFQELYDSTKISVAKFIRRAVHRLDEQELSLIHNEVYFKLWRALGRGQCFAESDGTFLAWLKAIAVNTVNSYFRRERRHVEHRREWDDMPEGWVNATLTDGKAESVQAVLAQIGSDFERLLRMRYIDCDTCPEIVQQLHLDLDVVYRMLHKARESFRAAWEQMGG